MESGAKGCEVIVSGKLRAQRAKAMKFKDGYMIASGQPVHDFIDSAVRHVLLRQGVLGIKVLSAQDLRRHMSDMSRWKHQTSRVSLQSWPQSGQSMSKAWSDLFWKSCGLGVLPESSVPQENCMPQKRVYSCGGRLLSV